MPEQLRHRLALVEEEPAVASRHPGDQRRSEVGRRRVGVAVRVVGERPYQASLDQTPVAARRPRVVKNAVEQPERLARVTLGDEQPGEGELVVLGQVGRRIRRREPALVRPRPRVIEAALDDPHPRPGRRDRPHVRKIAGQEQRLGLVEHRDRAV